MTETKSEASRRLTAIHRQIGKDHGKLHPLEKEPKNIKLELKFGYIMYLMVSDNGRMLYAVVDDPDGKRLDTKSMSLWRNLDKFYGGEYDIAKDLIISFIKEINGIETLRRVCALEKKMDDIHVMIRGLYEPPASNISAGI